MNFRKLEVRAYSKEEAIEQSPFTITKDATLSWTKQGKPMLGNLSEFMLDYLEKNTKGAPGLGCIIVVERGRENDRERPYLVSNVANNTVTEVVTELDKSTGTYVERETTRRKFTTAYTWVDDKTKQILGEIIGSKAKAKAFIIDLYKTKQYAGNATCFYTKKVIAGESRALKAKYVPSVKTALGTYILFGVEPI
jgi:hypothetical protein